MAPPKEAATRSAATESAATESAATESAAAESAAAESATSLSALARAVQADGLVCALRHGGACLQIFQEEPTGFTHYEVVPWPADPRIPVLYFTQYREDAGATRVVRTELDPALARWVTATEHPLTALPVLHIHPCHTQEWLADTGGDWHLWLQHFGRCVGLQI